MVVGGSRESACEEMEENLEAEGSIMRGFAGFSAVFIYEILALPLMLVRENMKLNFTPSTHNASEIL